MTAFMEYVASNSLPVIGPLLVVADKQFATVAELHRRLL